MRTAIVSDLHLSSGHGEDLLRDADMRRVLLEEVAVADRLVLLGDAIETRVLPISQALEVSRPFFEELGEAMAGREVLFVPGNHDHRLVEPQLETLAAAEVELGLEHVSDPIAAPGTEVGAWLGDARLRIAYPGIWLRDDVYATHGHYMDCHMTLPRAECVAAAAIMRVFGEVPETARPRDYEAVLRPLYGFSYSLTQTGRAPSDIRLSERVWRAVWRTISGPDPQQGLLRRAAARGTARVGIPAVVGAVNKLLRSDFEPDLTPAAITRSGIEAATEMARRLDTGAAHLIVGHTHRAGPRADETPWRLPGGGNLHNTGCWTFTSAIHEPGTPPGPYWPGTVTWVEDEGPPRRVALLEGHSREALRAIVRRQDPRVKRGTAATRR